MELKISNLSKNYGKVQALNNINITLSNGIYGLLGPNGAGKSTLINLLTDNVRRESGDIMWNGTDILKLGAKYRNILGYMPQQQGYYEDFSAGAFLMYMSHIKGMNRKNSKAKVSELLNIVNLSEYENDRIGGFSGGMKQRLLLAQALLNDPEILILDEPTAGVDPQERIRIRNFISEIAENRIVIIATHIVSDVESIAKAILLMKRGEIIASGTPYELIKSVEDKVYEINIPSEKLKEVQNKYIVSNIRHAESGLDIKIITEDQVTELKNKHAVANLDDVYLNYFDT